MTTEYLTELIITTTQSSNTLFYLCINFSNLNTIHQSTIQYDIHRFRNDTLVVHMKNCNRGEILNLKAELNSNGYNVNMMTLSSNHYFYMDIINSQCLTLEHDLNTLTDERLSKCVSIAKYFNFTAIHEQLQQINNNRHSMDIVTSEDELSSLLCGMDIDC